MLSPGSASSSSPAGGYPCADEALARRLERTEAHANTRFVESHARLNPEAGFTWTAVDGASAMFDGVGSPLTQTFGLGMFAPATSGGLDVLEAFFRSRGADVFHEVSPLADASVLTLMNERGYRPCEFTNVMFRPVASWRQGVEAPAAAGVSARIASGGELDAWAATAARGWSEFPDVIEFMKVFGPIMAGASDACPFLAEADGRMIATAMIVLHGDTALLAGASTVPEARGRGAQAALLSARLQYAAQHGCTLAMMCARPGSASQRNAERRGFRIAYTRLKWHKAARAGSR